MGRTSKDLDPRSFLVQLALSDQLLTNIEDMKAMSPIGQEADLVETRVQPLEG